MAQRRIYFEPGTTREQLEMKLGADLRLMLGFIVFFIGSGVFIWFVESPSSAFGAFVIAGLIGGGLLWSQSRRRSDFVVWQYEQERLNEEAAERARAREERQRPSQ
jgi:hypothetical protein